MSLSTCPSHSLRRQNLLNSSQSRGHVLRAEAIRGAAAIRGPCVGADAIDHAADAIREPEEGRHRQREVRQRSSHVNRVDTSPCHRAPAHHKSRLEEKPQGGLVQHLGRAFVQIIVASGNMSTLTRNGKIGMTTSGKTMTNGLTRVGLNRIGSKKLSRQRV